LIKYNLLTAFIAAVDNTIGAAVRLAGKAHDRNTNNYQKLFEDPRVVTSDVTMVVVKDYQTGNTP
jgi:hypothetical protein